MDVSCNDSALIIKHKNRIVFQHSKDTPSLFLGVGEANYDMYRGNFDITDYVTERLPMRQYDVEQGDNATTVTFYFDGEPSIKMVVSETEETRLKAEFVALDEKYNRFWIRLAATEDEKVYGCGEQLTYFNLRGKNFPLWSSEPGVGRNKNNYVTWLADVKDKAGGDYYNTNYPQPTFVSDKNTSVT